MKSITVLRSMTFLLLCGLLYVGCSEDGSHRTDGGSLLQPDIVTPPPPEIAMSIAPDNNPKVQQGASLQFAVNIKMDGVTTNADPSELTFSLSNPSVGSIGANSGVFTADLNNVGKSDIIVTFTRGTDTKTVTFTDAVEVVNQVTTPSPPKRIMLQPTQVRLVNGGTITFTLSVERQDGITVSIDPVSNEYIATLSNAQVGVLTLLDFAADANNVGFSDISVDVTMAGVLLTTNFPNAIEVVVTPPPPPPPVGYHFNTIPQTSIASMTSEVTLAGASTGRQGLVAWGPVISVSGNLASVKLYAYCGPYANGDDDNTLGATWQPGLWRGYTNGAQNGKDASFYTYLPFTEVAGSNRFLWEVVVPTFPTNGTFSYGITLDGDDATHLLGTNVYMAGAPKDSSFNPTTNNLEAIFNATSGEVETTPAP